MNEYSKACRRHWAVGARMKAETEDFIMWQIKGTPKIKTPCKLKFTFYEPNLKRDNDNVKAAHKFILDSMVKLGIIPNDSQKHITEIYSFVELDRKNPRIEVEVLE